MLGKSGAADVGCVTNPQVRRDVGGAVQYRFRTGVTPSMSQLVVSSRVRRGGALLAAVLVAAGCNSAADTEIAATSSVVPATSSAAPSETGQRPAEAVAPSPDAAV